MELYAAEGMSVVRELLARGNQVFLDLKLYDIPETVMRAAVEGRGASSLQLLAVTVLTSFDQHDLAELGYPCPVIDLVRLRTQHARACSIDGIVCSPLDAPEVRAVAGPDAIIVTPGVRSRTAGKGDQKRIATPAEAIAAGANYLVIGRQVTRAADPKAEVARILEEIATAR